MERKREVNIKIDRERNIESERERKR